MLFKTFFKKIVEGKGFNVFQKRNALYKIYINEAVYLML
jgi:hypothetical protein